MQPKARMTFRFDPPKPSPSGGRAAVVARELDVRGQQPPLSEAKVYHGGPLHDDPYTLEEIIRGSDPVKWTAAATIPAPDPAPAGPDPVPVTTAWTPAADGDDQWSFQAGRSAADSGPSWWRVFASVAGAIATGALFGYLVLTLFTGEPPFPGNAVSPSDTAAKAAAESPGAAPQPQQTGPAANEGSEAVSAEIASIPAETYYLLQYGVFRSEGSMNAAVRQLEGKGLPGTADRTDGYRVFIGAAATKEDARLLAAQMPDVEVFVKASAMPAATPSAAHGGAEAALFVQRSDELIRDLTRLSVLGLQDVKPQPTGMENMASLRESHRRWQESAAAADRLAGPAGQAARSAAKALNAAMVSVDDYGRNPSRFHLWNIQSDVMAAIAAERALRTTLEEA